MSARGASSIASLRRQAPDGPADDGPAASGYEPEREQDRFGRHRAAIDRSLGWAEAAAARGDYQDALGWLAVVEAVGPPLTEQQLRLRSAWLTRLIAEGPGGPGTGPQST
ncbi:hypothetical protein [Patulibacter medicamentivorans]|uniref:hypothetical protein n=1 Tax=Patulibacter medicamentivorans TaxID=1097667 RepID=UPI001110E149|nr:hypothetical protein [Patulibacter medicamentivorans]